MSNRWSILAVLFFARLTMAFQFQSVAALSPLIVETHGLSLADIGLLIGIYLAPGIVVAIPGGAIAARFGDKPVVEIGMLLMLAGGATIALASGPAMMIAGRLISGAGGVVVNIVMTKMLVDWFAGREISTAMAIFINSWPVGIALALLTLPSIALAGGLALAWWGVTTLIAVALLCLALFYRAPPGAGPTAAGVELPRPVARLPYYPLFLAGMVWALYNSALAMVFSFGTTLLNQKGWSLGAAGSATSAFMVALSIALPLGGILADRTGRRDAIILVSLLSFVLLMPLVPALPPVAVAAVLLVVGGLFALAGGPIMTLPAQVLPPEARTFGMGVFFTLYYAVMMLGPRIAGALADRTGDVGITFHLGALMSAGSILALFLFRRAVAAQPPQG